MNLKVVYLPKRGTMNPSSKKWDPLLQNRKHPGIDPIQRCQNTVTGYYLPLGTLPAAHQI